MGVVYADLRGQRVHAVFVGGRGWLSVGLSVCRSCPRYFFLLTPCGDGDEQLLSSRRARNPPAPLWKARGNRVIYPCVCAWG